MSNYSEILAMESLAYTLAATLADPYKTKFHRCGTVTFWDVYQQMWVRTQGSRISDECLASLSPGDRRRIARASGGAK